MNDPNRPSDRESRTDSWLVVFEPETDASPTRALEDWISRSLADLEHRFADFVTPDSLRRTCGSRRRASENRCS